MTPRPLHTVLVPGLACSARLYEELMPYVWAHGAATLADTRRDHSIGGIAERLLADAPPRFALAGISMGGYVTLEVMRQAPERVRGLALISTSARSDTPEQEASRRQQIDLTHAGKFDDLVEAAFPVAWRDFGLRWLTKSGRTSSVPSSRRLSTAWTPGPSCPASIARPPSYTEPATRSCRQTRLMRRPPESHMPPLRLSMAVGTWSPRNSQQPSARQSTYF